MKTVEEWFRLLPIGVRNKARTNANLKNHGFGLKNKAPSLHVAILISFNWIRTPQGHSYWSTIYQLAERGYYDKKDESD
jgi:hypothetical protein